MSSLSCQVDWEKIYDDLVADEKILEGLASETFDRLDDLYQWKVERILTADSTGDLASAILAEDMQV